MPAVTGPRLGGASVNGAEGDDTILGIVGDDLPYANGTGETVASRVADDLLGGGPADDTRPGSVSSSGAQPSWRLSAPATSGTGMLSSDEVEGNRSAVAAQQGIASEPVNDALAWVPGSVFSAGPQDAMYPLPVALLANGFTEPGGSALGAANVAVDDGNVADNGIDTRTGTPEPGFAGPVELTYDVTGGQGGSTAAHATLELLSGAHQRFVFASSTADHGTELWVTDGTEAGTLLLADIMAGAGSSSPDSFTRLNDGRVLFLAESATAGRELWVTDGTAAGTFLLKDIRAGVGDSSAVGFTLLGDGRVVFRALESETGFEVWITDGTAAGTLLLKDIAPGTLASLPSEFTALGDGRILFRAGSSANDNELWITDGTAAGTMLVADINPGASGSSPQNLVALDGGRALFTANDGASGIEIWVTDGTQAGTTRLADIAPGSTASNPSLITLLGDGRALFRANDGSSGTELWITDGSAAGTLRVKDINSGSASSNPNNITLLSNGLAVFSATTSASGTELWVTDGSEANTLLLKEIGTGAASSSPLQLVQLSDGLVLFTATGSGSGTELWVTDGTGAGTVLLKDIVAGSGSSSPTQITVLGDGRAVFVATDAANGQELWVTDGSAAGTALLMDIDPGAGSSAPLSLTDLGDGRVSFTAYDAANGSRIWITDGTVAGTVPVHALAPNADADPADYTVLSDGRALFTAFNQATGNELWITDGTAAGTALLRDIAPGLDGSTIRSLTALGDGRAVFAANDGSVGQELWVTDGTTAGTVLLANLYATGVLGSGPISFTPLPDGRVMFVANGSIGGQELYVTDGTVAGTVLLKDINAAGNSAPGDLTALGNGQYVFAATSSTAGRELWVTDGTAAGTLLVKDIFPGSGTSSSSPTDITALGDGRAVFRANDGTNGLDLWVTDGTAVGTFVVKDLQPGTIITNSYGQWTSLGDGRALFSVNDGTHGTELWVTDATATGTFLLQDIVAGTGNSTPTQVTSLGDGRALFSANGPGGIELWVTDGTTAGTLRVKDINANATFHSVPSNITPRGDGTAFFTATDGVDGRELWVTDGTEAGTVMVADINPGAGSSDALDLTLLADGRALFSAVTATGGRELWITDGTSAGTMLLRDIWPGSTGSNPTAFQPLPDGRVLFTAADPQNGNELWVTDGTAAGTQFVAGLNNASTIVPSGFVAAGTDNQAPTGTATAVLPAGTEDTPYLIGGAALLQGFSDADGDALSIVNLVADRGTIGDNGDGTYDLTPEADYNGPVRLDYLVSDGTVSLGAVQFVEVAAVNDAPTLGAPLADQSAIAGAAFVFVVSSAAFADVDGDTLDFSAVLSNGNPLPAWLTFDATTRAFTGTPAAADAMNLSIVVTATDPAGTAVSDTFVLQVVSVNATPDADLLVGQSGADFIDGLGGDDSIHGAGGSDTIYGGSGDDSIDTGSAEDVALQDGNWVYGGSGDDTVTGGDGYDYLYGGSGNDSLAGGGGSDQMYADGGSYDDDGSYSVDAAGSVNSLSGGAGTDYLVGGAGNDLLDGGDDDDYLTGGAGDDTLLGGEGDDQLDGSGGGTDMLQGGAGNDTLTTYGSIYGDTQADQLSGGDGDDRLVVYSGGVAHTLSGGAGADTFALTTGGGTLNSWVSAPVVITDFNEAEGDRIALGRYFQAPGGVGSVAVFRGAAPQGFDAQPGQTVPGGDYGPSVLQLWTFVQDGRTVLYADTNRNFVVDADDFRLEFDGAPALSADSFAQGSFTVVGTPEADVLVTGDGADRIDALAGDDTVTAGAGSDTIYGGSGDDSIDTGSAEDVTQQDGNWVYGGSGDDTVTGGDGYDYLYGGSGNDSLAGGGGSDQMYADGGSYDDDGSYSVDAAGSVNSLSGGAGTDYLIGGAGNDLLDGGDDYDYLTGGAGDDTLLGGEGDDQLDGSGGGTDMLQGGAGNDIFYFYNTNAVATVTGGTGVDSYNVYGYGMAGIVRITDFAAGVGGDQINLGVVLPYAQGLSGDPFNPQQGFLRLVQMGADTALQFDRDGAAGVANDWQTLVRLVGVDATTLTLDNFTGWGGINSLTVVVGTDTSPTLTQSLADQTAAPGAYFSFAIPEGTFIDVDEGDTLVYAATLSGGAPLPSWLSFDAASKTFSGTPPEGQALAPLNVVVTVTDSAGLSASDTFVIAPPNSAPTGTATAVLATGSEDTPYTVFAADLLVGFSDADGDTLSVANLAGSNGSVVDNGDGSWTFIPAADFNGTVSLTYDVVDGHGGSVAAQQSFDLAAVNDAPTVDGPLADQTATTGAAFVHAIPADAFADVDGDLLTLTAALADGSALPEWLVFDPDTGSFSGTPSGGDVGQVVVRVTATDEAGAIGTSDFVLVVDAAPNTATPGNDTLVGTTGDDIIDGLAGDDDISGLAGNDLLFGGEGADTLAGGEGNDSFFGGDGIDLIDGGADEDTGEFDDATEGLVIDLGTGVISNDGFGNAETISNVEIIGASQHADRITMGAGGGLVVARGGDDTLIGGAGGDVFYAGSGNDSLVGGDGDVVSYADEFSGPAVQGIVADLEGGTVIDAWGDTDELLGIHNLQGSELGDSIAGSAAANWVQAIGGDDTVSGGDGDDYLNGGLGRDLIDGGEGFDFAVYETATGSVVVDLAAGTASGADGDDTLANIDGVVGSEHDDLLSGDDNGNILVGGTGNDTLAGNDGDDVWLDGADGNDSIAGGAGNDALRGGAGDDTLSGGSGYDYLRGGAGNDVIDGGGDNDEIEFGDLVGYNDYAAAGAVLVDLDLGTATFAANGEVDTLVGLGGAVGTDAFGDTLRGGASGEYLGGKGGDDLIEGRGGTDRLQGEAGDDTLDGGDGFDQVGYWESDDGVAASLVTNTGGSGATGNDVFLSIEGLQGGAHHDTLTGDGGDNWLWGQAGNDTLDAGGGDDTVWGGVGDDTMDGGVGRDQLHFSYAGGAGGGVVADLGTGFSYSADGNDQFSNFEDVVGSEGNDTLYGDIGGNLLDGAGGDDELYGNYGDDTLIGGAGEDTLIGGVGVDRFVGTVGELAGDRIEAYALGEQIAIAGAPDDIGRYLLGFDGTDSFVAIDTDGDGAADASITLAGLVEGTLTLTEVTEDGVVYQVVTVEAPDENEPPVGTPTGVLVGGTEDTAYIIQAATLLLGFSDPDGDALAVANLATTNGSLADTGDGTWTFTPDADFNGTVSLTYDVVDGNGGSVAAQQSFDLAAVNDGPTGSATADLVDGSEDTPYTLYLADLIAGFGDVDGDALSAANLSVDTGSVVDNGNDTWTVTLAPDAYGPVTVSYDVVDGNGGTLAAEQSFTIAPVNDNPVSADSSVQTDEDTPLTATLPAAADVEGDTVTYTLVAGAGNGSVVLQPDGSYTYTPGENFHGTDSFRYQVADGFGGANQYTVQITVNPINDAPAGAPAATLGAGTEDTPYLISAAVLLQGFGDVDGDALAVANLAAGNGSLVDNGNGTWTFTPDADFNGTVSLNYDVVDGNGGSVAVQQSFDLAAVNDAPSVAAPLSDQTIVQGQGYAYVVPAGAFTDADLGDTLTYSVSLADGSPLPDWLSFDAATRSVSGTAPGGFDPQPIELRITATDLAGTSASDSFTLTIERAQPTAQVDTLYGTTGNDTIDALAGDDIVYGGTGSDWLFGNVGVDTLVGGDGDDLLAGQWDADVLTGGAGFDQFNFAVGDGNGDRITDYEVGERLFIYAGAGAPATTLDQYTLRNDGNQTFIDFDADGNGIADLTLTLDGVYTGALSLTRQAIGNSIYEVLSIGPANAAPTGSASAALADGTEDTPYLISAAALLEGFSDADGDTLSVVNLAASSGSLADTGDGTWTFTPDADFNGTVSLTYDVVDGNGGSVSAQQSFDLAAFNDAPTGSATADLVDGSEDTPYTLYLADLIAGFGDVDGDTLSVANLMVSTGSFVDNGDGTWTVTLALDAHGPVTVQYDVVDGNGGTLAAEQSFTIAPLNDNPVSADSSAQTDEDTPLMATLPAATDVDGDALTYTLTGGAEHGTVVLQPDGSYTYTPNENFHGADSFRYQVADGFGGANQYTVQLTVNPVNDAPTGTPTATLGAGAEDTPYLISAAVLLQGFGDVDGDALAVADLAAGNGSLVDNGDGTWTFTPDADFNGSVSLSYDVVDGNGGSVAAQQSFEIVAVNDAPVAADANASTDEDQPLVGVLPAASDADGDTVAYSLASAAQHGTVVVEADGSYSYTPDADFNGGDSFSYTVSDGNGGSNTYTVGITVDPVNDAPTGSPTATLAAGITGAAYLILATSLLQGFADVDGDVLSVVNLTADHGSLVDNGDDTWTFTPDAGYSGTVALSYEVSDGTESTSASQSFSIVSLNTIYGTPGNDTIDGSVFADAIYGLGGYDVIYGYGGDDAIDGGSGYDQIYGGSGNDTITLGDDGDGSDGSGGYVDGGSGDDVITGSSFFATYTYDFGDGYTYTYTYGSYDQLFGGEGNDTIDGGGGYYDYMDGGVGDDVLDASGSLYSYLYGGAGNDTLLGGSGYDALYDYAGNNVIVAGDDSAGSTIYVGGGDDSISGSAGADYIYSSGGSDTVAAGDGVDRIYRYSDGASASQIDAGAGNDEITVYASSTTAQTSVTGGEGRDTYWLQPYYEGSFTITDFATGADGDLLQIDALLNLSTGYSSGNPFDPTQGYLRLVQQGTDTLLQWDRDGSAGYTDDWQTVVTLQGVQADTLTLDNFAPAAPPDGSSVGLDLIGTPNGDVLQGSVVNDTIEGLGGYDLLYGYGGDDAIDGGSGYDQIYGGSGNDTITLGDDGDGSDGSGGYVDGGSGDDVITGSSFFATYTYDFGDGYTYTYTYGSYDQLFGGEGNDTIDGGGGYYDYMDGGVGDDVLDASGSLYSYLYGGAGNDTLLGGSGYDALYDYAGNNVIVAGDDSAGSTIYVGGGDDSISGSAGADYIYSSGGSDTVAAGDGVDRIYRYSDGASASQIDAGAGNDEITVYASSTTAQTSVTGGEGRDTYWLQPYYEGSFTITDFATGADGDLLQIDALLNLSTGYSSGNPFDPTQGYLRLVQQGTDTLLQWDRDGSAGYTDDWQTVVTLQNVDATGVSQGAFVPAAEPNGSTISLHLVGTPNGDVLQGSVVNDTIEGLGGYDLLYGYGGDDAIDGGSGYDQIYGGSGNDTITLGDDDGSDGSGGYVDGGSGDDAITGSSFFISYTYPWGYTYTYGSYDHLVGGDGNDTIDGGGGYYDYMNGGDGDDVLDASEAQRGDLSGGSGNDTLIGSLGRDSLYDSAGDNVLVAGDDLAGSTIQAFGNNDSIRGSAGTDWIYAYYGDDTVQAGAGDDRIYRYSDGASASQIDAGAGNDEITIYASSTTAQTSVTGGEGRDTYWLQPYYEGSFTITDFDAGVGGDLLKIEQLLNASAGYTGGNPFDPTLGYLRLVQQGSDTLLQWDADGATASNSTWRTLVTLQDVDATALDPTNFAPSTNVTIITIVQGNQPPVVAAALSDLSTEEDAAFAFTVPGGTFVDVDSGTPMTLSASLANGDPLPGWLGFDPASGTFSGTPGNADVGVLQIRVTATDADGASVSDVFALTIVNANDGPTGTATATLATGTEDTPYLIEAAVLLQGFADPDGDTLSVANLTASNGTLVDNGDGTWTYTPQAEFNGVVSLTYDVADGNGGSLAAQQSFEIAAVNDVPTGSATADLVDGSEDTPYVITAALLLQDFSDVDGDPLSVANLSADHGSLVDNGNGTWTFRPTAHYNGTVSLSYDVIDGNGGSVAATQGFALAAVNDAPAGSATALLADATEDMPYVISAAALLQGFADVDGDTLAVADLAASRGSLIDNGDGTWTYTPDPDDFGTVVLTYDVVDGNGGSVPAERSFEVLPVNDAPVAADDSVATDEDQPLVGTLPAASDVESDTITYALESQATHGTVVVAANGSYTYTPGANFNGSDSFSYTVSDGNGGSNTYAVDVTVNPVNDNPVANADSASTAKNTAVTIAVLANDSDADAGDTLTVSGFTQPANGTLVLGAGGSFVFTPKNNWTGTTTFSYTIGDGNGGSATAQVTVRVDNVTVGDDLANTLTGSAGDDAIRGLGGDDTIDGKGGNDRLEGGNGNDLVVGGSGGDVLRGGLGNDTLYGGVQPNGGAKPKGDGASDTFVFDTAPSGSTNHDTIVGFEANALDQIALDPAVFAALVAGTPALDAGEFRANATGQAQDGNDFIVFDTTTGSLYYDADGSGAGARVLFGTLQLASLVGGVGAVDHTDFSTTPPPGI
jgi:ELWxxDGT repeat protein